MVICLVLWVLANYIFAVISHLRASFPAVLLLSVRLMAGHIKETFILLFTMAGDAAEDSGKKDEKSGNQEYDEAGAGHCK